MLVAALLLAFLCSDGSPPPCARAASRAPAANSVAVLYFDNLSRDSGDAYLADGLTRRLRATHPLLKEQQVQRQVQKGSDPMPSAPVS